MNGPQSCCDYSKGKTPTAGHLSLRRTRPIMRSMNWKQAIARWRKLPPEEQDRIRLARLPRKVARSMAFEGEPVDQRMLERELDRHARQPVI